MSATNSGYILSFHREIDSAGDPVHTALGLKWHWYRDGLYSGWSSINGRCIKVGKTIDWQVKEAEKLLKELAK